MYWFFFFITFLVGIFFTIFFGFVMNKLEIVDKPKTEKRKIHKKKIPYGGGLAIFFTFFIIVFLLYIFSDLLEPGIGLRQLLALFFGGLVLMIGGYFDDKYVCTPKRQIIFPILASLIVLFFGIKPVFITNPWGQPFDLSNITLGVLSLADFIVFFWLMGMMYTTKFLDGLDGLVAGIVLIGSLVIFFLCLQKQWYQPDVALLTIIFVGALAGFLIFNFHPAKIFLGEGGSLFTGFMLGCLAIISGSKIATTLLVIGVPMLDVGRVIIRRWQKNKPIYLGDSEHLHFRLLNSGLTQVQVVLLMYVIAFLFGITTLFLQSSQKIIALLFLFVLMMIVGIWFSKKDE
jgi:UDP-GlcNAc:undecaprenyl-phosphate GlcNAc-1-phosphate transferase